MVVIRRLIRRAPQTLGQKPAVARLKLLEPMRLPHYRTPKTVALIEAKETETELAPALIIGSS